MDEGQPLAGFYVRHPAVEHGDAVLERRQLILRILFEPFAPTFPEIVGAHVAHELENQFAGGIRSEQRVRIARGLGHIQRGYIDIDFECGCLAQGQTVERQIAALDLGLVGEVDTLAFLALRDAHTQRGDHEYLHQNSFHVCFHIVSKGRSK